MKKHDKKVYYKVKISDKTSQPYFVWQDKTVIRFAWDRSKWVFMKQAYINFYGEEKWLEYFNAMMMLFHQWQNFTIDVTKKDWMIVEAPMSPFVVYHY